MKIETGHTQVNRQAYCLECEWKELIKDARRCLYQNDWASACEHYAKSYKAATKLLSLRRQSKELLVNRYIRTCFEYIYCLRKSGQNSHIKDLIQFTMFNISEAKLARSTSSYIRPLVNIASCPEEQIAKQINMLFAIDEQKHSTIH